MAIINYIEKHLKTFAVKKLQHSYWEIIYTTEGVGRIETESGHVLEYKKGEMVCIPPNVKHINNSSVGFKNIHFTIEDWNPSAKAPHFNSRVRFQQRLLYRLKTRLSVLPPTPRLSPRQPWLDRYRRGVFEQPRRAVGRI